MTKEIFITGRDYKATGLYVDGRIVVNKGSHIKYPTTNGFIPNESALSKRNDPKFVRDGIVIEECTFDSPSTAAQFVTGGSRNGYDTWKISKGYSLGQFLEEAGIRTRKTRKKEQ